MQGNSHNNDENSSGESAEDSSEADADDSALSRGPRRARDPAWLTPSDLDSLVQRFAPLDFAQVRHMALVLAEGSTPVEILILRLVGAGLTPSTARRFIAELRLLRERPRSHPKPGGASPANEVAAALNAAAMSYLVRPGDDEEAARAIMRQVKWSMVRARWFVSVNRDLVRRMADRLKPE